MGGMGLSRCFRGREEIETEMLVRIEDQPMTVSSAEIRTHGSGTHSGTIWRQAR